MTWTDELRAELERQRAERTTGRPAVRGSEGEETQAGRLVRDLLDQLNRELLAGRGAVWEMQARWGAGVWELWWAVEAPRPRRQQIVVTMLHDSRGTPYLKVQRRRLPLQDPTLERRLQLALRAAFMSES